MSDISPYRKSVKVLDTKLISCFLYFMKPGGIEEKHFHDGIEIEYVLRGNSKTHKQGHIYFRKKGEIHEAINDSNTEMVFVCLTVPAESRSNTHYL